MVGALLGIGILALTSPAMAPEKTFTVVAYHWGFAIYDEQGNEIPRIEVAQGTVVTLLVIGAEALSHEIHEAYVERVIETWADNPDYGGMSAEEIEAAIEGAGASGLLNHSLSIDGYDVEVPTDVSSPVPQQFTFIAHKSGTFAIRCLTYCGSGHGYMVIEDGFVVN